MHPMPSQRRLRVLATGVVLMYASAAFATPFTISGGSYTADVIQRLNRDGTLKATLSRTFSGDSEQFAGSYVNVADGGHADWSISGIDAGDSATVHIDLDKVYTLNRIATEFGDFNAAQDEIRVSPDGVSWVTLFPQAAAGAADTRVVRTFAAQPVKAIEYQVFGPGTDLGTKYTYVKEIQAYVASSVPAADAPQIEQGYDIAPLATVLSSTGWISYADGPLMTDGNPLTYSVRATEGSPAVLLEDFGNSYVINRVNTSGAYGQSWAGGGKIEFSNDLTNWTAFVNTTGPLGTGSFAPYNPVLARYMRVTNNGNGGGAMAEVMVFAVPLPEPACAATIAFACGALFSRRGRR